MRMPKQASTVTSTEGNVGMTKCRIVDLGLHKQPWLSKIDETWLEPSNRSAKQIGRMSTNSRKFSGTVAEK